MAITEQISKKLEIPFKDFIYCISIVYDILYTLSCKSR